MRPFAGKNVCSLRVNCAWKYSLRPFPANITLVCTDHNFQQLMSLWAKRSMKRLAVSREQLEALHHPRGFRWSHIGVIYLFPVSVIWCYSISSHRSGTSIINKTQPFRAPLVWGLHVIIWVYKISTPIKWKVTGNFDCRQLQAAASLGSTERPILGLVVFKGKNATVLTTSPSSPPAPC